MEGGGDEEATTVWKYLATAAWMAAHGPDPKNLKSVFLLRAKGKHYNPLLPSFRSLGTCILQRLEDYRRSGYEKLNYPKHHQGKKNFAINDHFTNSQTGQCSSTLNKHS